MTSYFKKPPLLFFFLFLFITTAPGCKNSSSAQHTWALASEGIFSATVSNQYALVGSVNGNAELWRLKEKSPLHTWQHGKENPDGVIGVAIGGKENFAVTAGRSSLAWWRIKDGKLLGSWTFPFIKSVSLSPNGRFALIGLSDQALYFALQYGKTVYRFDHEGPVDATALSDDGKYALTGSDDTTAALWRLDNGKQVHRWNHAAKISSVALSPKSAYAMTNEALGQTRIWSVTNGTLKTTLGPKMMTVSTAAFSPEEKFLATGRASQRIDLWNLETAEIVNYWRPQKNHFWRPSASTTLALEFVRKGKGLLSASSNGFAQMWKTK